MQLDSITVQLGTSENGYVVQTVGHRLQFCPGVVPEWCCSCGFAGGRNSAFDPTHLALRLYGERVELQGKLDKVQFLFKQFSRHEISFSGLRKGISALR